VADDALPSADELERLGLYDPAAADAAERRRMLESLLARGGDLDEMVDAWRSYGWGGLTALRVELSARLPGRPMTFEEGLERSGVDAERLARVWRAFGFPDPRSVRRPFTEHEVGLLGGTLALGDVLGEEGMMQLARVIGASMARIAEAGTSVFRLGSEVPRLATGRGPTAVAEENAELLSVLLPAASEVFDMVHRRHLMTNAYRDWDVEEGGVATTAWLAVGFADIVGFTARAQAVGAGDLAGTVGLFEGVVAETVSGAGARLVKLIGDEAMFVADDAATGCRVASRLVERFDTDPDLPSLRAAVAIGSVVTMHGDYYGQVVNLAARLVKAAEPSTVLVSDAAQAACAGTLEFDAVGPLALKGFDEPVPAFRLPARAELGRETLP
jgi:class 3 adenylate cyclase